MNGYGVDGNPGWPVGEGDPSTWITTSNAYQAEWQSGALLDSGTSTNNKIGWTAFDLGASSAGLDKLYLWNERERNDRRVNTYNVCYAESPTMVLPHGPTNSSSIDCDFSSGGWTLLNTGGVLTLPFRGSDPQSADGVISLGGISARYIAIEILSNGGWASLVGLAEVGITAVSTPPTFQLTITPSATTPGNHNFTGKARTARSMTW